MEELAVIWLVCSFARSKRLRRGYYWQRRRGSRFAGPGLLYDIFILMWIEFGCDVTVRVCRRA
jgi:hypothetical protein